MNDGNRDTNAPQDPSRGPTIMLISGRYLHPFDPRPEDIGIRDIAHGLAMQPRFAGHIDRFYSVAHHSLLVAGYAYEEAECAGLDRQLVLMYALEGLLHDAAEGLGFGDLPGPMKKHPLMAGYDAAEKHMQAVVNQRFGLAPEKSELVRLVDRRVEATEMRDFEPRRVFEYEPFPDRIFETSDPLALAKRFVHRFSEIRQEQVQMGVVGRRQAADEIGGNYSCGGEHADHHHPR